MKLYKRIGEGCVGALLGAVLAAGISYYLGDAASWPFVVLVIGACFVLAGTIGEAFLQWMADLLRHLW